MQFTVWETLGSGEVILEGQKLHKHWIKIIQKNICCLRENIQKHKYLPQGSTQKYNVHFKCF